MTYDDSSNPDDNFGAPPPRADVGAPDSVPNAPTATDMMGCTSSSQLGWHWIFDGWVIQDRPVDEEAITRALVGLPARLELTLVSEPQVFSHHTEPRSTAGIALLAESHFSLHAFPNLGLVHGDLFSCKPFAIEVARSYVIEFFGISRMEERVLNRGAMRARLRQQ